MKQVELAKELGVSKAYVSMVMRGRKKPSKQLALRLKGLGVEVNSLVNSEARNQILSHARLPIPTLPRWKTRSYNSISGDQPQMIPEEVPGSSTQPDPVYSRMKIYAKSEFCGKIHNQLFHGGSFRLWLYEHKS